MKKRFLISIFTILVAVSFIVGLAACGDSEKTDSVTQGSDPEINDPNQKYKDMGPSEGITFYEYDDHCVVTGIGTCTDEELIIPSEHEGLPVTAIDDGAFYYCKSFTTVYIPDSVTYVGDDAFYYCTYLKDVEMGDNVEYIGHRAFYFCKALENITLPESVTTIGNSAFESCTSLTYINIPQNVATIGEKAFNDCTSLEGIYINATLSGGVSLGTFFENVGTDGSGIELTIGSAVTDIQSYLFSSFPMLTSVNFEDGSTCKNFGTYSFAYNDMLKSITLPESLVTVEKYSFYECGAIEEIYLDSAEMESLGSGNNVFRSSERSSGGITVTVSKNVKKIAGYLFCPNSSAALAPNITAVIFEDDSQCESIGSSAFGYCPLTSITLPDSVTSIGDSAFCYCTNLTTINLPEGITSISGSIFYGCSSLADVAIPDSVTSIGLSAFRDCTSLTTIVIPDSVKSLGNYAISGCTSLESVVIGESVTSFGNHTFYNCTALENIYYNAAEVSDFSSNNYVFYNAGINGNGIAVTIGTAVRNIPDYFFCPYGTSYTPNIASVVFENGGGCERIGAYSFYNLTSLVSVMIPERVTSLDSYTFYNCTALEEIHFNAASMDDLAQNNYVFYRAGRSGSGITVTIGASVTEIPANLFNPCGTSGYAPLITSLIIEDGNQCTNMGADAFLYCWSLTGVYIADIAAWCTINFKNQSYNPLYYAGNLYLNGELVVDLVIPGSVTSIGSYTFYKNENLESLTIGDGVTKIGEYAFYNCTSLKEVTIGDGVTEIGQSAFYQCTALTSLVIPDGVTTIKQNAFNYCTGLTSLKIGTGVTSLEYRAFYYCTALREIYFNAVAVEVTNFPFSAAGQKSSGATITIGPEVTAIPAYIFDSESSSSIHSLNVTSVIFEENSQCTSIGDSAFRYCAALTSLTISDSITTIGRYAFSDCTSLSDTVNLSGVTSVLEYAFNNCTSLEDVIFGDSLTSISNYAFYGCTSLASAIIPDSITSIGRYAFGSCSALTNVSIGTADLESAGTATINDSAFGWCTSLTNLIIGCCVRSIGTSAFYYCTSLTNLVIPDSVTSIGASAFGYCTSLTSVTIPDGVTAISSSLFSSCSSLEIVTIPDSVTTIGEYAFGWCTSLKSVDIPDAVTSIGKGAFYCCSSFTSIAIPDSVITIDDQAFAWCENVTSIIIGNSVETIGDEAFYVCSYVTEIVIPDSVTSIGKDAFHSCRILSSIVMGSGVTSIGDAAFIYCYAISGIYYNGSPSDWSKITIGTDNDYFTSATIYYYSELEPDYDDEYSYWHYKDGEIFVWKKED